MFGRLLSIAFFYLSSWGEVAANAGGGLFEMMIPMALVFGIFYVLVIRPQQKKVKEHQDRLSALKKGDEVVVGGGIIGQVDKVDGDDLFVRVSQDVIMRCIKNSVTQVRERGKSAVVAADLPVKEIKKDAKKSSTSKKQATKSPKKKD